MCAGCKHARGLAIAAKYYYSTRRNDSPIPLTRAYV